MQFLLVTWTLSGPGTPTPTGLYTAPASIANSQFAVAAAYQSVTASAAITLEQPVTVTVNPPSATLTASQDQCGVCLGCG